MIARPSFLALLIGSFACQAQAPRELAESSESSTSDAGDPVARGEAEAAFPAGPGLRYAGSLEEAVSDADAVIVVTPWKDFEAVPRLLSERVVFVDARRAFDRHGIPNYEGIGL